MAANLRHIATEPANLNHKVLSLDRSPRLNKQSRPQLHASDSDLSVDTASLSQESQADRSPGKLSPSAGSAGAVTASPTHLVPPSSPRDQTRATQTPASNSEWEILEGLRQGQRCEEQPLKYEGYLLKRRKWPLKGWHKRYFVLDKGILTYAKSSSEMARGKFHGSVDVGLSVISTKIRGRRIDIDADESIYHLKVKPREQFNEWVKQLRHHRLFRQHELNFGSRDMNKPLSPTEEVSLSPVLPLTQADLARSFSREVGQRGSTVRSPGCLNTTSQQNKVAAWLTDNSAVEQLNKDLSNVHQNIFQLSSLLEKLNGSAFSASESNAELPELCTPNLKKDRKRFVLRRKKTAKSNPTELAGGKVPVVVESIPNKDVDLHTAVLLSQPVNIREMAHLSTSNPNLPTSEEKFRPHSLPEPSQLFAGGLTEQRTSENRAKEEFLTLAKDIHGNLRSVVRLIHNERERLRQAVEAENAALNNNNTALVLQQNSDLRARLQRIHAESEISEMSLSPDQIHKTLQQSMSYESSSVLSISEYYDAAEYLGRGDTSSEASLSDEEDDESFTSENSEAGTEFAPVQSDINEVEKNTTGRRNKLPSPQPDGGDFNLWNLLCKNIGKDLSKVCMPVTLNEPLNTLQRLCEELEYCELIEKAAEIDDPCERMVYVAAFAVSGYGSLYYRASHKPFNPLLGETYECIREDKGFRFIAEQVSHHPPISACHVETKSYTLWQDMRIKTTFWGKSMEIQPIGCVNLLLHKYKSHYKWNKVTTCIHNIFSGQRWVDQYGELCISDGNVSCKITFVKTSYWSNKKYELHGKITNENGKVVHHLFGRWNEALYCGVNPSAKCVWRPGAMPEDYKLYYGFTQFAIELNELDYLLAKCLPPTDTRFRPDQRLLEEGDIPGAEAAKLRLEQTQRERKKKREEDCTAFQPMWFKKRIIEGDKEVWEFTGQYWQMRHSPGFANMEFPLKLW